MEGRPPFEDDDELDFDFDSSRRRYQERETGDPTALLHQLTSSALARGEALRDLSGTRPTLEDVYLELTAEPPSESDNDSAREAIANV